jgi:gamma-glutamylputrescine oxidase
MLSFWESNSFVKYDYVIVGSGIVGLSVAASLIEKYPKANILVAERGLLPTGASTKNAGFACFGSLTELLADLKTMSADQVLALVQMRWNGLQKLRQRLGDEHIGYEGNGGFELLSEEQSPALEQMNEVNQLLQPIFGKSVFALKNELISQFQFAQNHVKALVENHLEGQIDTGLMMHNLLRYVQECGVNIWTGCEVKSFEDKGEKVIIDVQNTVNQLPIQAKKLIICTNAFTNELFGGTLDIQPGRGQVLVTEPIENLPFKGTFHIEEGYFYFRNYGNRVIFGGGRHLDFAKETSTTFELNQYLQETLEQRLREVILPKTPFVVAQRWAGIMAFGQTKQPILKHHSPNVVLGVRMGGMGVAIGSQIGQQVVDKYLN